MLSQRLWRGSGILGPSMACLLIAQAMGLVSCISTTGTSDQSKLTRAIGGDVTSYAITSTRVSPQSTPVSPAWALTEMPASRDWQTRWLRGIPCSPPCWEGVTPGQTSALDAVAILRASPVISNAKLYDSGSHYYGSIDWDWTSDGQGGGLYFDIRGPLHAVIRIEPRYPTSIWLTDVIQAYGEPSHIVALRRDNVEARETGRDIYDLQLVYFSRGFELDEGTSYSKPTLRDSQYFANLLLFAPTAEGFFQATGIPSEFLVPWQGFKDFQFYCVDQRTLEPCK